MRVLSQYNPGGDANVGHGECSFEGVEVDVTRGFEPPTKRHGGGRLAAPVDIEPDEVGVARARPA